MHFFSSDDRLQQITLTIQSNLLPVTAGTSSLLRSWMLLALTLFAAALLQRARRQAKRTGLAHFPQASGWMLAVLLCIGGCASLALLTGCSGNAPPPPVYDTVTVQASTPALGVVAQANLQVNMGQ